MTFIYPLLFLISCSQNSDTVESNTVSTVPPKSTPTAQKSQERSVQPVFSNGKEEMGGNLDQGQKHPPLPADNPAWEWDAQSFVPDFGWYGEHSWTDVRMRVVGHMAMAYRDLARVHILQDNWDSGIQTYQEMIQTLEAIDTTTSQFADEIRVVLLQSAQRDKAILQALSSNSAFPNVPKESLMHWRIEYWKLTQNSSYDQKQIDKLQTEITTRFAKPNVSAIDDFDNFTDRHKLRTELFSAYAQSLDPLLPSDLRWGYWRPEEIQRQAHSLVMALETLKREKEQPTPSHQDWWLSDNSSVLKGVFYDRLNELHTQRAIFTPSYFSYRLRDQQLDLSPEQLGRLPTGDSIIDVGGQPGPMGIGTLMKLDVSDSEHHDWLITFGNSLSNAIQSNPNKAVSICQEAITTLDAYSHGSRFYNVKQFRNACTRQLARLGHYKEALSIFNGSFPLHHQDWACPNRKGLLQVMVGRLEFSAGDIDSGIMTLKQSIQSSKDFLENVDQAQQGLITKPKPPMMGGPPNGKQGSGNTLNRPMMGTPQKGTEELKGPPNGPQHPKAGVRSVHTPHKAGNAPDGQKINHPDP